MAMIMLASRSPRRRELLDEHGLAHIVVDPGLDDADLQPGDVSPGQWAMSLAHLKASAGLAALGALEREAGADRAPRVVLGADTICVLDGAVLGKPADQAEARAMIAGFAGRAHQVITGVSLLDPRDARRRVLFARTVTVRVGHLPASEVDAYVRSDAWRGKAGGYNIRERARAGWPVHAEGDQAAVMGLPIADILPHLARFGVRGAEACA